MIAFLVGMILTVCFACAHREAIAFAILDTLIYSTWVYGFVSMLLFWRGLRKLGLSGEGRLALCSGPRPNDPDELRAWLWDWQWLYSALAFLVCLILMPVTSWISRR